MKKALIVAASILAACLSHTSQAADWTLVSEESRISFVSVKAEIVGETHYFADVSGSVTEAGAATIRIPLESVETAIDIRNVRMQEFLFEVVDFPAATLTSTINLEDYANLSVGDRTLTSLTATLDLHGIEAELAFDAFITRISDNKVAVDTAAPILLDADEFELGSGLDKLKELAGLDAISPIVPVTASLVFTR